MNLKTTSGMIDKASLVKSFMMKKNCQKRANILILEIFHDHIADTHTMQTIHEYLLLFQK